MLLLVEGVVLSYWMKSCALAWRVDCLTARMQELKWKTALIVMMQELSAWKVFSYAVLNYCRTSELRTPRDQLLCSPFLFMEVKNILLL